MKLFQAFSIIYLITLLSFSGCGDGQRNDNKTNKELTKVSLRQGWFPWAGYAGEMVAVQEKDILWGIDLRVDPGADDIDPIKMVLSGVNDFGITSAEAVVMANQKGADLVAVAVINYKSPTCFISLKGSQIHSPKDFEGKKVGILTGSETETVYRTLVNKLHLAKDKITEVEASYDLKTFINKSYDVYPGFVYSEPLALEIHNIRYDIIKPEDYGVQLMGAVYFTTRKFIQQKPKITQAFVSALADGWTQALKEPQKAMKYLKEYDENIDEKREILSLKKGIEYFSGENNNILYASDKSWSDLKEALVILGKIKSDSDIKQSYNNSFIIQYQKEKNDK